MIRKFVIGAPISGYMTVNKESRFVKEMTVAMTNAVHMVKRKIVSSLGRVGCGYAVSFSLQPGGCRSRSRCSCLRCTHCHALGCELVT